MNWIKKCLMLSIPIIITISGLEIGARYLIWSSEEKKYHYLDDYSTQELDESKPFIHKINGGKCINILKGKFNWNQWWGFSSKSLDIECVKEHFSSSTQSIVFMGGSVMSNSAPNHLTTIDYLTLKELSGVRSINLAESGARHTNMSFRFQRQVLPIKPDIVIFLDGYNEFNSIIYGGKPQDDYYWTAGIFDRIHNPQVYFVEKLVMVSAFFELLLVRTKIFKSKRYVTDIEIDDNAIELSAYQYLTDIKNTQTLCHFNNIKCFFIIQPHVYGSEIVQHKNIIQDALNEIPFVEEVRVKGYQIIIQNCEFCIDMSNIMHNEMNTFIDPVHLSKKGNVLLAKKLKKLVEDIR